MSEVVPIGNHVGGDLGGLCCWPKVCIIRWCVSKGTTWVGELR